MARETRDWDYEPVPPNDPRIGAILAEETGFHAGRDDTMLRHFLTAYDLIDDRLKGTGRVEGPLTVTCDGFGPEVSTRSASPSVEFGLNGAGTVVAVHFDDAWSAEFDPEAMLRR